MNAPGPNNPERALAMAKEGMTTPQIAEELGISDATARRYLREADVRALQRAEQSVRQRVEQMRPSEAVDYLLGVVDALTGALGDAEDISRFGKFSHSETRVLARLLASAPGLVTKDQLYHALTYDRVGEYPDEKIVDVYICKIRKKLRGARIVTQWGVGFRIEVEE